MSISSSHAESAFDRSSHPIEGIDSDSNGIADNLFQQCLLDNLRDGIIFVDSQFRILVWSQAIEVMTGMSASKVDGLQFTPQLLGFSDQDGVPLQDAANPLIEVIGSQRKTHGDFRLVFAAT